jgi:hypothetical protein
MFLPDLDPQLLSLGKSPYEATKWGEQKHLVWAEEQEKCFKKIKWVLTNVPVLGLPDVMKLFFLYVYERLGTTV